MNFIDTGGGIPLIFQHGIGASLSQPQAVVESLDISCRFISMDARGHGGSELGPAEELSISSYADDVLALMDHLALDQVVMGGISMGAAISTCMAIQAPERVKALILLRPAWLAQPQPEPLNILREIASFIGSHGVYEGKELFKRHPEYQEMDLQLPGYTKSLLNQFDTDKPENREAVLVRVTDSAPFKNLEMLRKIDCPTLIISSEDDPLHPMEYGQTLAEYMPGSILKEVASKYKNYDDHNRQVKLAIEQFWQEHIGS